MMRMLLIVIRRILINYGEKGDFGDEDWNDADEGSGDDENDDEVVDGVEDDDDARDWRGGLH